MPSLPRDVPRLTREIRQHWEMAGCPPVPEPGPDRHDALADARLAFDRWKIAQDILTGRAPDQIRRAPLSPTTGEGLEFAAWPRLLPLPSWERAFRRDLARAKLCASRMAGRVRGEKIP